MNQTVLTRGLIHFGKYNVSSVNLLNLGLDNFRDVKHVQYRVLYVSALDGAVFHTK